MSGLVQRCVVDKVQINEVNAWVLAPRLVQRQREQQCDLIAFLKKKVALKIEK